MGAGTSELPAVKGSARLDALAIVRALRPHQWLKNVLVFVPVVTAHRVLDETAVATAALAFAAFSAVASAGYVVNDLLDVEADRRHENKRLRPFASGALPIRWGLWIAAVMLLIGAALAWPLARDFGLLLAGYFAVAVGYTLSVKSRPMLDVLLLAALYTSRIVAGSLATDIHVTEWLAAWSMFLFLSLSFLKRASEMTVDTAAALLGRGYLPVDRDSLFGMGIASGYLSVLVLALYVSSEQVKVLYAHPTYLWGLCALMLYWISQMWMNARRGLVRDDPVVFALRDRMTQVLVPIGAAILVLAAG